MDKQAGRTQISRGERALGCADRRAALFFESEVPSMASPRPLSAALAALALLAACGKSPEAPPKPVDVPASITSHVRVLNADTLIIDGRHVRLANAFAPESLLHARCWAEALASDHAAEYVKEMVQHARTYSFSANGKTDSYTRAYGTLMIDGADLGDILYQQGLAARPAEPRFDWCQPISQKAEGAPQISSLYSVK
jgi:endonuclease YncB( thermonuclease family)